MLPTRAATPKTDRRPYGRGSGAPHPVDVEVGARIRQRRLILGMKQETLGNALGLTFQQIQKYENGRNRVSASRLAATADILGVPISYFFSELTNEPAAFDPAKCDARDWMRQRETIGLVRAFYAIPDERVRERLLALVKAVARTNSKASDD